MATRHRTTARRRTTSRTATRAVRSARGRAQYGFGISSSWRTANYAYPRGAGWDRGKRPSYPIDPRHVRAAIARASQRNTSSEPRRDQPAAGAAVRLRRQGPGRSTPRHPLDPARVCTPLADPRRHPPPRHRPAAPSRLMPTRPPTACRPPPVPEPPALPRPPGVLGDRGQGAEDAPRLAQDPRHHPAQGPDLPPVPVGPLDPGPPRRPALAGPRRPVGCVRALPPSRDPAPSRSRTVRSPVGSAPWPDTASVQRPRHRSTRCVARTHSGVFAG